MVPNAANRHTSHIRRKPASHLHHAIRVAERLGRPLNTFVTINIALIDCPAKQFSARFSRLRELGFARWARIDAPPTFAWCLEAAGGVHAAHWLVHVPAIKLTEFSTLLITWSERYLGRIISAAAVDIRLAHNPIGAGRYMLKGMDPVFAKAYGVDHAPQGIIVGKRSGVSRSLGPAARRRLGYKPRPFQGLNPKLAWSRT